MVDELENIQGAYEGIDVEDGVYTFFNDKFRRLIPRFVIPNERSSFFGLFGGVQSGTYVLEPESASKKEEFLYHLGRLDSVNPNRWFKTVEDVRKFAMEKNNDA
ncbi:MAG: hypothetical protein WC969_08040 [Elusimicrobiota bacterium]